MPEHNLKRGFDFIGVGVVFFCHDGKGNFVMARRSDKAKDEHGRWDIGGGGVEFSNTIDGALKREIMEEYCTPVLEHEFLGFREVHRVQNGKHSHWIALDFKVLVDREKVTLGEPEKFTDLKWFTFESLPPENEQHSQMGVFFKNYRDRL